MEAAANNYSSMKQAS